MSGLFTASLTPVNAGSTPDWQVGENPQVNAKQGEEGVNTQFSGTK